jgi:hypothetical protein
MFKNFIRIIYLINHEDGIEDWAQSSIPNPDKNIYQFKNKNLRNNFLIF